MDAHCDSCQTVTAHKETVTTHLPEFVPKYKYPFEHKDALTCTECGTTHEIEEETPEPAPV